MLHKHIYGEDPPRPPAKPMHVPLWRRLPWYVFQTAIVAGLVWFDHAHGKPSRPGLALAMGIGYAIAFTILIHLTINGVRRLSILVLSIRRKNRDPVSVGQDGPFVPLEFLRGVDGSEGKTRRDRPTRLRDPGSDHFI